MTIPLHFEFVNPNPPEIVEAALRDILLEKLLQRIRYQVI